MRITIIALGSRGDVQPYVALGKGLQAGGHIVNIAAPQIFEELVCGNGLSFSSIRGDPGETLDTETGRDFLDAGNSPLKALRALRAAIEANADSTFDDVWNACQGTDAIICSILGFLGYDIAEKLGVPSFAAYLQPFSRTREIRMLSSPKLQLGGAYNRLTYVLGEWAFWKAFGPVTNRWRDRLGLPPTSRRNHPHRINSHQHPTLYGYSPNVLPRPADWGDALHVTGYWFLDRPDDWLPPVELVDFIESGPPPVYVGFGSMRNANPEEVTETVVNALGRAGQRGVLSTGWGGLGEIESSDDVFVIESIPHDWLFPRMAAVVHHGGAGTTGAGLRAGVPSILVPYSADQYFWGERVQKLGAGPKSVPRKELTEERLAAAIHAAVSSSSIKSKASALGERIRAENGVTNAVEAFHLHIQLNSKHS
jgi:UDP:flavonoid glycosyltransferase YjiC (YdhE family)